MWTIIYSLRREDAARLEFDNADAWRTLLMENAPTLAKSMKISLNNFHWYAAFHDEGHHPHIHMMVWSDDPKEGFLTKDGIAAMRSKLTNAIFRDEMQQIYERKDVAYSDLVEAAQNAMREMISRMQRQVCDSPIIEDNMHQLVQTLETTTGKKQYGYALHIRDELVADAFASLPEQEQGILILHCVLELADGEIGGLVGMSRSAVQRHRTKALNELRKRLEDERRKPK